MAEPRDCALGRAQGPGLQAFHEDADNVAIVRGEDELIVGDVNQGTPLAGFDVFEVVEQVDGLADAAGAAEEDMADGFAGGQGDGDVGG